ncbi:MAG: SCO family protein [Thermoanaerobaculia bacterium]
MTSKHPFARAAALAFAFGLLALPIIPRALGQPGMPSPPKDVGFDQKLGAPVPLDLPFRNEQGQPVTLGSYFGGKPVILSLVYYECPMLCGLSLNGLASSLSALKFEAGQDFEVVSISFDPVEKPPLAAAKKSSLMEVLKRPSAKNWHFLTGDAAAIKSLTAAVGFRYVYDARSKQFAHAAGLVILTPQGQVSRYLFGTDVPAKDLRLALIEAADSKIGSKVDQLLLLCYQYDPKLGRYGAASVNLMRGGGILTVLALVAFFVTNALSDRRARQKERAA